MSSVERLSLQANLGYSDEMISHLESVIALLQLTAGCRRASTQPLTHTHIICSDLPFYNTEKVVGSSLTVSPHCRLVRDASSAHHEGLKSVSSASICVRKAFRSFRLRPFASAMQTTSIMI